MLKVLELFAGIGACSKALTNLGIPHEIVDAVEIDKFAIASFNAIHGTNFEPQDITQWDKNVECDLIIHGSPCQDFSLAGLGKGGDKGSGTRSSLMYESIRIVNKVKPKIVIWENVKAVLSKKHKHNFDHYQEAMASMGYRNYYQVLNAKDYGIPQNRERVFTVSIREDIKGEFVFPDKQPLEKRLKDVLEKYVDESYYLPDEKVAKIKFSHFNQQRARTNESEVANTLCARDWKDPQCVKVGDLDIKGQDCIKRVYSPEGISPALTTMGGGQREPKIIDPQGRTKKINTPKDYAPPFRVRKLTPKECWRLMGFDDEDFEKASKKNSKTQLYKQAGNSIVVDVLMAILNEMFGHLKEGEVL